jgi:hypothetical protein
MTRKVFGRREVEIDGRKWLFEMRKDGVWCWPKRKHKHIRISFHEVAQLSQGQRFLFDIPSKATSTATAPVPSTNNGK